jgi:hypothetical protein
MFYLKAWIARICFQNGGSPVLWLANSTHDLKVVGWTLVSSNILDGNSVKAMSGSIPAHNSGSIWKFRKNIGSQMEHTNKKYI